MSNSKRGLWAEGCQLVITRGKKSQKCEVLVEALEGCPEACGRCTRNSETVIAFMQSFGSSDVPSPSRCHAPYLSVSTCDDGQQLKQLRRAEICATKLQWHAYHDKLHSHEPVPLDPTQQPDVDENCSYPCLQHAPPSTPMPPASLGIAVLVPNVPFDCKDSTGGLTVRTGYSDLK